MNPMMFFADLIPPHTFWNAANGSPEWWTKTLVALLAVSVGFFFMRTAGPRVRRLVIGAVTLVAGAFFVLYFIVPQPVNRHAGEMPMSTPESLSFWFDDALPIVSTIANTLAAFLLGLGVYSVLTIHVRKVWRQQRDWGFSVVLLVCIVIMALIGYADWYDRKFVGGAKLDDPVFWGWISYANDFFFNGLLQQMDAAMFSVIAFYILSAAYRAFRIRSVEATILLASALVVMLSLMGAVEFGWNVLVGNGSMFTLTEIAKWLRDSFQTPAIRAIDFGVGIGALAMGLRLWLSLEKQGAN